MRFDVETITAECIKAMKEKVQSLKKLNIIVVGKTGVGKSTLINSVFREKIADTGIGKPVTDHMRLIEKKNIPLSIYDTKGFELGQKAQDEVRKEILQMIQTGIAARDINRAIHCIWYCVNTASNRIEPEEIEWIRDFTEENKLTQVSVIIILTQSFSKTHAREMKDAIENENLNVMHIVPVLAEDYIIDEGLTLPSYGLDRLIQIMEEALPDELQDTLQNVQKVSLESKNKRAQAVVATAVAAALAEAASPIPLSDSAMLIPTQAGMIAGITAVFGIEISRALLFTIVSSTLGAGAATFAGKSIVSGLLKLIPGVGTVAGTAISASTAGILTTALGETYIAIMNSVVKGEMTITDLQTREGKEHMKEMFKKQLAITDKSS